MSAEFCAAAGAVAMELGVGDVMGLQQGVAITAPSPSSDLGLLKRAALTQAAAAAPYPSTNRRCSEDAQVLQGAPSTNRRCSGSPRCSEDAQKMLRFCPLDEQKMLRFSKVAHTLPSGLHFGGPSEQQAFLLSRTKRPFTPSQWMELEHQALIYKYLNAKAPIPSSLLISISKSFRSSNRVSWRPLYQGYTNADADPEPGRCRRTDGKKWRCSKEAMADHKYCERHINRNRHRSRKPVENQPKKTTKEVPAAAGSLPCAGPQGSLKKAKVNDSKPGTVSYWTDSLNGTMLSREKANKPTEDNSLILNSTNSQPTLSLLSQLKQNNKPDKLGPTLENESNSDAILKAWGGNQPSHKSISSTQPHDAESLQSVLQNFSLAQNEKIESEKNKYSDSMPVSSTFYSAEGLRSTCLTPNMTQGQHDCISSSWQMPQGGPLGEILTNSKNSEDLSKCESRSYGWLLNLDHAP